VTIDPHLAASAGPGDSRADIRRIVEHTGWSPEISWEASVEDLWNEVRARPRLPLTV
jgi:GDP-4-dehydro-6-deoxy-D-mannose reductase